MVRHRNTKARFAICINADGEDALTPLKIYWVLPDKKAQEVDYIRVIDDDGEDYLYPENDFIFVNFPPEVERALLRASK